MDKGGTITYCGHVKANIYGKGNAKTQNGMERNQSGHALVLIFRFLSF